MILKGRIKKSISREDLRKSLNRKPKIFHINSIESIAKTFSQLSDSNGINNEAIRVEIMKFQYFLNS